MTPPAKRKTEDEFILTISDNENDELPEEKEIPSSPKPSSKKRKREREASNSTTVKKNKKAKKDKEKRKDLEHNEGIWGAKGEDDGAMDSEFEFLLEDGNDGAMEEFEGWGFEGARKGLENGGLGGDKKAVDIDVIIARRREKRGEGKIEVERAEIEENGADAESSSGSEAK
jgi:ATP-dependent RNA helicase DDX27